MGQVLANGVVLGCLFAGVAVGLTLIYGVMEVPNFAHSGIIALSAYATYTASQLGAPFVLAAVAGIVAVALFRRLQSLPPTGGCATTPSPHRPSLLVSS